MTSLTDLIGRLSMLTKQRAESWLYLIVLSGG